MLQFIFSLLKNEKCDRFENIEQKKKYKQLIKHLNQHSTSKFKNVEIIGKGSFGFVVKLERSNDDGVKWFEAIKVIKKQYFNINEVYILEKLKKINHPNILEYYQFEQDKEEKYCYIYTEYIDGVSIDKKLEQMLTNSFTNHMVHCITTKILDGLFYIHNENIIHRDIKSSNIMISNSKGNVKIIDYGLSKIFQNDSKNFSLIGTINYIAPEVIMGNNTASRKSDIWSLGCTIIEMVGGDLKKKVVSNSHQKEIPFNIVPSLKHFIGCCLIIDPLKRSSAFELLNHQYITKKSKGSEIIFINQSGSLISGSKVENQLLNSLLSFIKEYGIQIIDIIEIGNQSLKIEIINDLVLKRGHYTLKYFNNNIVDESFIKKIESISKIGLPTSFIKKYSDHLLHFMENKEGITLNSFRDKFKDKIIPTTVIKRIIKQILDLVLYLYDIGIRDIIITINNIIVNNDFQIYIIDYIRYSSSPSSSLEQIGKLIIQMLGIDMDIDMDMDIDSSEIQNIFNQLQDHYSINFIQHCFLNNSNERYSITLLLDHHYLQHDTNNNILYWDVNKPLYSHSISNSIDTIIFGTKYNKPILEKIPSNITSIQFNNSSFNYRIGPGILNQCKSIKFNREFNQSLSGSSLNSIVSRSCNKTEINYNGYSNQPMILRNKSLSSLEQIQPLSSRSAPSRISSSFNFDTFLWNSLNESIIPKTCTSLDLGYMFNNQLILPNDGSLTNLCLSECYNLPLSVDSIPKSLKYLRLGDLYNYPLTFLEENSSLISLCLGSCFNQPISHFPPSLTKVSFGFWYSQPLTSQLVCNLVSLTLSDSFNQCIDSLFINCRVMRELCFGFSFNNELNNLPPLLETLQMGACFNKPINSLPKSLTVLKFPSNSNFNQPLLKDSIPKSIKELYFGHSYEYPLSSYFEYDGVDFTITKFDFNPQVLKYSPKTELINIQIPPSTTRLELLNYKYDFKPNSIPKSTISLVLINYTNIESLINLQSTKIIDLHIIYNDNNNHIKLLNQINNKLKLPTNITSLKINDEYIILNK